MDAVELLRQDVSQLREEVRRLRTPTTVQEIERQHAERWMAMVEARLDGISAAITQLWDALGEVRK